MRSLPPPGSRFAKYARYSSALQSYKSIEGQERLCDVYAEKQGWVEAGRRQDILPDLGLFAGKRKDPIAVLARDPAALGHGGQLAANGFARDAGDVSQATAAGVSPRLLPLSRAAAQNLRKLAKLIPPPTPTTA